ncbi:hypothetical protein GCM10007940_22110 [Portibacter lacus]|uniref:Amidohydrolase-related domain-containing protein n=1 Tax=Portibacter lacus TaxID=1099794 RepID=A0AA37SN31_9BACT|nr:hypothetical protein GCM10007940_22110 [Portibacter lacus]
MVLGVIIFIFTPQRLSAQDINDLKLKDYRPESIYNVPKTSISKAKFPVIDMHSHAYAQSKEDIDLWIQNMDAFGIEKTILLTYQTGEAFDSIYDLYNQYDGRFEIWCGFDYTGYNEEGWSEKAVAELIRCHKKGARGIGELGDKGYGLLYSKPTPAHGMHLDDERMRPLLEKCGELNMPVNVHIAEPYWMYEPIDEKNDGLMNAGNWRIDTSKPGYINHEQLIQTLENAVKNNSNTTFIACHYANCSYDLDILGNLLDLYPNLYADISARYAEVAPVPRRTRKFIEQYSGRLLYGTDMGFNKKMYEITFRILETADEHFYEIEQFNYHWPLYGLNLSDRTLKKIYYENAKKILDGSN